MLFDLRSRGRRRMVKVIYLGLAILMGGGLILFGVGSGVSGGLFDAFSGNSGGSSDNTFEERVEKAQDRAQASPKDAAAWAALAVAEAQMAGVGENFDQTTRTFTDSGKERLRAADRAWQRYVALDPKKPDGAAATQMVQVYAQGALNDPAKAAAAQEMAIAAGQDGYGQYAQLAVFAYQAGQTRKGDLAADKALELADDKMLRDQLEASFKQAKSGQLGGTTTATPSG
ncbi:MAG TPA: Tar ligand binding domain-containing protein [Capillimicrobium sp.]|nr:Tar ligand binding domain-containing protein [Capillimicrobium sp.]